MAAGAAKESVKVAQQATTVMMRRAFPPQMVAWAARLVAAMVAAVPPVLPLAWGPMATTAWVALLAAVVAAVARHAEPDSAELVGLAPEAAFDGFPAELPLHNRATIEEALRQTS